MKKTKIDWCDSTINCVYGCPNNCKYCYGNVMNKRFHFCKDWSKPEWKPEHLKDFYGKKPKSIFIDSMSDIGTWKQEWFNAVANAIHNNPQHRYIALTKKWDNIIQKFRRTNVATIPNLYIGMSITTQNQADDLAQIAFDYPDFLSIEPILEPIKFPLFKMPRIIIIGAETGNRKGKVIPEKEWIDEIVKCADKRNCIVFMKESLRKIMGDNFRQDKLPWGIER